MTAAYQRNIFRKCPCSMTGQLEGDLFFDFGGEVNVAAAGAIANLHLDPGHGFGGVNFVHAHPDMGLVDLGLEGIVDRVFGGQLAVKFEDSLGGGEDLRDGAFVAAGNGVLDERDAGFGTAVNGIHTAGNGSGEGGEQEQR